jgi:hypothetical protein
MTRLACSLGSRIVICWIALFAAPLAANVVTHACAVSGDDIDVQFSVFNDAATISDGIFQANQVDPATVDANATGPSSESRSALTAGPSR